MNIPKLGMYSPLQPIILLLCFFRMSSTKPTKKEIENCFGVPIHEACLMLGLETKELQKLCREYKIKRWPKTRKKKSEKSDFFQTFTYDTHSKPTYGERKINSPTDKLRIVFKEKETNQTKRIKNLMKEIEKESSENYNQTISEKISSEKKTKLQELETFQKDKEGNHLEKEVKTVRDVMSINNLCN